MPEGSPPVAAAGEGSPDQCQSVGLAAVSTLRGSSTDSGDRNSGGDGDGTGEWFGGVERRVQSGREKGNRSVILHLALERTDAGEEVKEGGRNVELVDEMADSGGGGALFFPKSGDLGGRQGRSSEREVARALAH